MLKPLRDAISRQPDRYGRWIGYAIVVSAILSAALVWNINFRHPRTNDAMIRANTIDIVIQHVNGRMTRLEVADNQWVHQGDLLYEIDARPYEAAMAEAEADLLMAEREISGEIALIRGAEAKIREAEKTIESIRAELKGLEARARYADSYVKRLAPMESSAFVTHNQVRLAEADHNQADAQVRDAKARIEAAEEALKFAIETRNTAEARLARNGNDFARVKAAEARLERARLNVEYCRVLAPFDGYVTNLNSAVGQYVAEGQKIFALVDDRTWYVIANYKETYLRNIRPGLPVDVFLAAYPGKHFRGEVQGIGWANYPDNVKVTNALPEVERTLNWVVLAGRFPVRIRLLEKDPDHPFRMGMTAFTTVGLEVAESSRPGNPVP